MYADVPLQAEDPRERLATKTDLRRSTLTGLGDTSMFIGAGVAAAVAHVNIQWRKKVLENVRSGLDG